MLMVKKAKEWVLEDSGSSSKNDSLIRIDLSKKGFRRVSGVKGAHNIWVSNR